ncbi:MAG TPA: hypothetical protein VNL77_08420, partial [Roseiflexaceae bacterium]|nr:hypothetical protein [Roseiflexaceae bacterium]
APAAKGGVSEGAAAGTLRPLAVSLQPLGARLREDEVVWGAAVSWVFVHALGRVVDEEDAAGQSRAWLDEWLLGKSIERALRDLGADEGRAARAVAAVKIAVSEQAWHAREPADPRRALRKLLGDDEVRRYIGVNRYQGVLWFSKERFEELLWWLLLAAALPPLAEGDGAEAVADARQVMERLTRAGEASGYQLEKLLLLAHG